MSQYCDEPLYTYIVVCFHAEEFFKYKNQAIKYTITEVNKQERSNKDNIRNKLKTVTQ